MVLHKDKTDKRATYEDYENDVRKPLFIWDTKNVENCELFYYIPTAKSCTIESKSVKGDKGRCVKKSYQFVSGFII